MADQDGSTSRSGRTRTQWRRIAARRTTARGSSAARSPTHRPHRRPIVGESPMRARLRRSPRTQSPRGNSGRGRGLQPRPPTTHGSAGRDPRRKQLEERLVTLALQCRMRVLPVILLKPLKKAAFDDRASLPRC